MLFGSYRGTIKYVKSAWYTASLYQQFVFNYFDVHHKTTFKELQENLHHRFSSFPGKQISRYTSLSVPDCKLVENILHTFCLGQSWYDLCILRQ